MYCVECGAKLDDGGKYYFNCGTPKRHVSVMEQELLIARSRLERERQQKILPLKEQKKKLWLV